MTPQRVQLRRAKGWRKPGGAVVVARGTDWGNPFKVGSHATVGAHFPHRLMFAQAVKITPALAVELYRAYITERGALDQIRRELHGKDLACWCPLEDAQGNRVPCHADVLLEIANPSC